MSDKPTFFSELKRRNVYKVAVAYVVVSWLLIQAASIMLPAFEAPAWVIKVLISALLVGFPIALGFSWAFEITSEGIKRETEVAPNDSIVHHTGRKLIVLTVIVALLAAGLFAWQVFRPHRSTDTVGEAASFPVKQDGKLTASPTIRPSTTSAPVSDKSIAVLPFDNLSDDKSNTYFAEGIQDEILTRLSKIAALKVISRTSTKKYQSAPDNLKDVAHDLGVAHVLEGSVQKIANAVKVNVQLIRASTDEHVWAESYNRKLDDVFGVEGEVANAIADQLQAKLTGAEAKAINEKPTENAVAYDAYLRGLAIEHNDYSYGAFGQAARAYVRAVELDPKFAIAWARLGIIRSFLYFNDFAPAENTATSVKEAADRAMALAPEACESWIALGAYRYRVQRDFENALAAYQEALKRAPNNSFVYQYLGIVQRRLGKWQEAEVSYKRALELDPRDVALLNDMGNDFYFYLRRFDEAYAVLDRAQQLTPDSEAVRANKVNVLQAQGRLDDARQQLSQLPESSIDDWVVNARINQAIYERQFDTAVRVIERKLAADAGQPGDFFDKLFLVNLGYCQEWLGHAKEARNAFTRAVQAIKPTPETVVGADANGAPTTLALAYAGLGEKEKALAQAQQALRDYATDAVFKPTAEITLAQIQARFGDHEAAIAALPHLLEVPAGLNGATLKFDPMWDPLREDPRFQKLATEGVAVSPNKSQP
jgi:TolB-like protein/Tfp pilus assembly protein PilF/predicted negative regulator of RcsB-dependent stress response